MSIEFKKSGSILEELYLKRYEPIPNYAENEEAWDPWQDCVENFYARNQNFDEDEEPVFSASRTSVKYLNSKNRYESSSDESSSYEESAIHISRIAKKSLSSSDESISESDFKNSTLWYPANEATLKPLYYDDDFYDITDEAISGISWTPPLKIRNSQIMDELAHAILEKDEVTAYQKIVEANAGGGAKYLVQSLQNEYRCLIDLAQRRNMYDVVYLLTKYAHYNKY